MIDDILDNLDVGTERNIVAPSESNSDELLNSSIESSASIFTSINEDGILNMPSIQQSGLLNIREASEFDLFPDSINNQIWHDVNDTRDLDNSQDVVSTASREYLYVSNQIDVDNLANIPHTDGLNLSQADIELLNNRADGIVRENHKSDISFGKKGDPGECCTRHCCTGASYCDKSYGDFH